MRLIDADALRRKIMQEYDDCTDLLDIIDEQPTAYDVGKAIKTDIRRVAIEWGDEE